MAYPFDGKAVFSTRNGAFLRRERIPAMRIILRSDPNEDLRTMVMKLQKEFPEVSRNITSPVTDSDVYEYFDYCDAAVHGFEFLRAVLKYIAALNNSVKAEKAMKVRAYVDSWRLSNPEAFNPVRLDCAIRDLFTSKNIEEHGVEFLTQAMAQIKCQAMQENDNLARQSALHFQMQHAQMTYHQSDLTQSPKPARPPFPADLFQARVVRAVSNSEYGHQRPQGGSLRHSLGPPSQYPALHERLPFPYLTSSTELLEHVNPGITGRGDFQSDLMAHNNMDASKCGPPNDYGAVPSRGAFTYQPRPLSVQHLPLLNRRGSFNSNLPKGKRNPKKASSDDARMLPRTGDGLHQASSAAGTIHSWRDPRNTQLEFPHPSHDIVPRAQNLRPSSAAVPYAGNHCRPKTSQGHDSARQQEPFRHPYHHEHDSIQSTMKSRSRKRTLTNPFGQSPRQPIVLANRGLSGENIDKSFIQDTPPVPPPLDPHAFGRQPPDRRIDAQCQQDHVPESRPPTLAPLSNVGWRQLPGPTGYPRANEVSSRLMQEGCKIWIGGIPDDLNKAAVMDLLKPCRGLLDISWPKASKSNGSWNRSYVFADFQEPVDAAEALTRIPQTKFPNLPEGAFLRANFPLKPHQGEDSSRNGKTTSEHGRKPSNGSARREKGSIGVSEGKPRWPSKYVSAVDANLKDSCPQHESGFVGRCPNGKAGWMPTVNRSSADGPDSVPTSQDPGVVASDVGVENHADHGLRMIGDKAQDVSWACYDKIRAASPKLPDCRTNATGKKSKASNKLSDEKESGSLKAHTAPSSPKGIESAEKSFLGRKATENDGEKPQASVPVITETSDTIIDQIVVSLFPPVPIEPALSAVPPDQSQEPISQAMRQNASSSTQSSTESDPSVPSYSKPPSSSQTDHLNSILREELGPVLIARNTHGIRNSGSSVSQHPTAVVSKPTFGESKQSQEAEIDRETSLQNAEHGQIAVQQNPEHPTSLASVETGKCKNNAQLGSQNPVQDVLGSFQPQPIEEDTQQIPFISSSPPSLSNLKRAFVRSPARQRPSATATIPLRPSSLLPSTPIKTHRKKQTRILTPVKENSPSEVIGRSIAGTSMHSSLHAKECPMRNPAALTIDSAAPALKADASKDLPKPETPFLMDNGVSIIPPKINRHVDEASNADQYYAHKDDYHVAHWGFPVQTKAMSCSLDRVHSPATHSSETSIFDLALAGQENDLETTLREAGFHGLSDTIPFTILDPTLAWLDTIDDDGKPLKSRTNKDECVLSWNRDTGKIGQSVNYDTLAKQDEMVELVRKATAARRHLAGSPPFPWIRIVSLRQQLARFVTQSDSDKVERQTSVSKAQRFRMAEALLRTVPRRDSSTNETRKWSRQVSHFVEENAPGRSPSRAESRNSPANWAARSAGGTSSRAQQQERRQLILMNRPESQTRARKSGRDEDAFPTASTEFNYSFTSGQTTESEHSPSTCGLLTPSEDDSTPSAVLESFAAYNPGGRLKDLFVEIGEDRQCWFEGRHQIVKTEEEEHTTASDLETKPGGEFDVHGISNLKVVEPKYGAKALQQPHADKPSSKEKLTGSAETKRGPVESNIPNDPVFAKSLENDPAHPEESFPLLKMLLPLSESSYTTSNEEGISTEAQGGQSDRGWQRRLPRSGYSVVAGRGIDQNRGARKEEGASIKDPWAIPEGERPWGKG